MCKKCLYCNCYLKYQHMIYVKNIYIVMATQRLLWLVQFVRSHKFKINMHFILSLKSCI
jgi:hypothetical protein